MKKQTFIILISCVTILCVCFGIAHHIKKERNFIKTYSKEFNQNFGEFIEKFDNAFNKGSKSSNNNFNFSIEDDDDDDTEGNYHNELTGINFSKININADIMGVTIERGDSYSVKAKYNKKYLAPQFQVDDDELNIKQHGNTKVRIGSGNKNCKLIITVPYGTVLDEIEIGIDVGAVEISGFDIKKGKISTDVGAVNLDKVDFDNLKIDTDVGAVGVKLLNDIKDYTINLSTDVGAVEVGGANYKRSYNQNGATNKTLKINTDVGAISIK